MGEGIRGAIPISFCFAKEYMYNRMEILNVFRRELL